MKISSNSLPFNLPRREDFNVSFWLLRVHALKSLYTNTTAKNFLSQLLRRHLLALYSWMFLQMMRLSFKWFTAKHKVRHKTQWTPQKIFTNSEWARNANVLRKRGFGLFCVNLDDILVTANYAHFGAIKRYRELKIITTYIIQNSAAVVKWSTGRAFAKITGSLKVSVWRHE